MKAVFVVAMLLIEMLEPRALLSAPEMFASRGPGGGGAFFAPTFSPKTVGEFNVPGDMSGVYHSTATAASWQTKVFRRRRADAPAGSSSPPIRRSSTIR